MKIISRILLAVLLTGALLSGPVAAAAPMPDAGGYTITDYDVHAVIAQNNVYNITETIKVNFSEPRHGIYRTIPINTQMKRVGSDGKLYDTEVPSSVSSVKVKGTKYSVSSDRQEVNIRIGDSNKTVTGDQTYVLSYKLRFGNDGVDAFDEVYYNIIGTDWDTTIGHVSFSIELPKSFGKSVPGFSMGSDGAQGYNQGDLTFQMDGNTISGETHKQLGNYNGVTLRLELPQGYFKVPDVNFPDYLIMGIIGLLCLFGVLMMLLFGIDYKPVQTVEFYAPPGMTPTDVGYINDGAVDDRDVVSLLLYWADKGYLKIDDLDTTSDGGDKSFKFTKLKELGPDAKDYEKTMFAKFFKDGPEATTDKLENKFYKTVQKVQSMVAADYTGGESLFTKASMRLKPLLGFLTILPMVLTVYLEAYRATYLVGPSLMLGGFIGLAMLLPIFLLIHIMRTWKIQSNTARAVELGLSLGAWAAVVIWFVAKSQDNIHTALPWVAAAGTLILSLCAAFISKRTKQSAEWYAKISAFRDFIVLAEKDKLVALVEQNPSYFYNVLPYAYVMNVTDKWANNFESIAMEPPSWYNGLNGPFNSMMFMHTMNTTLSSISSNMVSAPSSGGSSGGGSSFSGGGFSGGGGGGGGGGSW